MNIFESLENLNVSEECFQSILSIAEEIINEVSDKKYREKIEELRDGIKRAEEFKKNTKDDIIKDKLDNAIISQEHRLNVSQDKYEDRIIKREKEKYDKNKAKKEEGK